MNTPLVTGPENGSGQLEYSLVERAGEHGPFIRSADRGDFYHLGARLRCDVLCIGWLPEICKAKKWTLPSRG